MLKIYNQQPTTNNQHLEDKFIRYTKLYILIFLMFLSIPVILALIIGVFYGFSRIISSGPVDIAFQLLIICLPAALFSTVFLIFFKRTSHHPAMIVRTISKFLFSVGFILSVFFLIKDIISFYRNQGHNIDNYNCFGIPFLAGNIGGLFLIAIVQAFTTRKEKDWIDRVKEGNDKG